MDLPRSRLGRHGSLGELDQRPRQTGPRQDDAREHPYGRPPKIGRRGKAWDEALEAGLTNGQGRFPFSPSVVTAAALLVSSFVAAVGIAFNVSFFS